MRANVFQNGVPTETEIERRVAELDPECRELWKEKYEFNKSTLGLSDRKAQDAAFRTIRAFQQVSTG